MTELAALGCVETVDFKGRYGLEVASEPALVEMYGVVLAAFPSALLEDPHELDAVQALLEPVRDRAVLGCTDPPRWATSGPRARSTSSPPGSAACARCFEIYEFCSANGVAMYGGGMGELGIGRGQIELLAALFHADAPNDVAPSAFNAEVLADGLPASPLVLDEPAARFRWGYEA